MTNPKPDHLPFNRSSVTFKVREPANKEGFGYVVWQIIGGPDAKISEAAKALGFSGTNFSKLLHHDRGLSLAGIERKAWRDVLPELYPEAWALHKDVFEQRAQALKKSGRLTTKPPEKSSVFGGVIWDIIGGPDGHIGRAAKLLKLSPSNLSSVIHGKWQVSQKTLDSKNWRTVLEKHYPEGWKRHRAAFEKAAEALPADNRFHGVEPKDASSIGHTLYQILGGRNSRINEAAVRLDMRVPRLSRILQGTLHFPVEEMERNKWRETFAAFYSKDFVAYRKTFEDRIAALKSAPNPAAARAARARVGKARLSIRQTTEPGTARPPRPNSAAPVQGTDALAAWRTATGTFVRDIRVSKDNILKSFTLSGLSTFPPRERWDLVHYASPHVPLRTLRELLTEIQMESEPESSRHLRAGYLLTLRP